MNNYNDDTGYELDMTGDINNIIREMDVMNVAGYSVDNDSSVARKIQKGGELIGTGGFGCVFRPSMNCSGKTHSSKKYVSKVQVKDRFSENEVKMASIIKSIKQYRKHFAPVVSFCKRLSLVDVGKSEISTCPLIETDADPGELLMTKMRYVDGNGLDVLYSAIRKGEYDVSSWDYLNAIIGVHIKLLNSVELLNGAKVYHMDIRKPNVILEGDDDTPIIIDFGLAFQWSKVRLANMGDVFYVYAPKERATDIWSPEVMFMCYLVQVAKELGKDVGDVVVTGDMIDRVADDIAKYNDTLNRVFSEGFMEKYRSGLKKSLGVYKGKKVSDIYRDVLKSAWSWNNYNLGVMICGMIDFVANDKKLDAVLKKVIMEYKKLVVYNTHPVVEKRISVNDTLTKLDKIDVLLHG